MVLVEQSELGNKFEVITNEGKFNCAVVENLFMIQKKDS